MGSVPVLWVERVERHDPVSGALSVVGAVPISRTEGLDPSGYLVLYTDDPDLGWHIEDTLEFLRASGATDTGWYGSPGGMHVQVADAGDPGFVLDGYTRVRYLTYRFEELSEPGLVDEP